MLGMGGSVIMSTYLGENNMHGFNKDKVNTSISLSISRYSINSYFIFIKKHTFVFAWCKR